MSKLLALSSFILSFATAAAAGDIRFQDMTFAPPSAGDHRSLLFHAETSTPGFGSYRTLFLTDIKTKKTTQLTFFPESISFLSGAGVLQIQNRFGVFRSGTDLKSFSALSVFPAFVNGSPIEEGKITPAASSPDGRYLVFFKPTDLVFGSLMLFDVASGKEIEISQRVPLSLKSPPVSWSPDSRAFVYAKDIKLYYFSIDQFEKERVISEHYRRIADGFLSSVQWDAFGGLYFLSGHLLQKIDSAELFARGLYAGALQIGTVAGKIAVAFEPNIDRYWLSPDGRKIILNKAAQSVLFMFVTRNDEAAQESIRILPQLSLPPGAALAKVVWPSDDRITLLAAGLEKGTVRTYLFRLGVSPSGAVTGFTPTADHDVTDIVLSADETKMLLVKSDRVEIFDNSGWNKRAEVSFVRPLHAVWKSAEEIVIAGADTIELRDLGRGTSTLLTLARAGASGFSADGKSIMTRIGDKAYIASRIGSSAAPWTPERAYETAEPLTAGAEYRIYLQDVDGSCYKNMIMVRDLNGLATAPLFPFKTFEYERIPTTEEETDPVYFNHGSRIRRRETALVFNGVSSAAGLAPVLAALKEYGVRATFFLNGEFIRRHPESCREIAAAGHEIGSLFYAYFNMTDARFRVDTDFIKKGLARNEDEYFKATGRELALIWHAPFYFTSSSIIEASKQMNYVYVGRDIDSLDWVGKTDAALGTAGYYSAPDLVARILAAKKPGSIIPIELGSDTNHRDDYLYQYVDVLINALFRLGYDIVPVSTLMEHAQ